MLFTLPRRLDLLAPRFSAAVLPALGVVALCVACSSDDGKSDGAAGATGTGGDASGSGGGSSTSGGSSSGGSASVVEDPAVGTFAIQLILPDGTTPGATSVNGSVRDAVLPQDVIWELSLEEGGCRLLEPRVPFCETPCPSGSICVEDDVCQETPPRRNAGTVTITGLQTAAGGTEVVMEPIGTAPNYSTATALNYPPFAEGDTITLSASGADVPAFQVQSQGISPLQMLLTGDVPLESGQPISLQWTPPTQSGGSTIRAIVDISHHGGQRGEIICDVPDDGSLDIPAALATRLLELGYSGFPTVSVERRAVGSVDIATGRVDLVVQSRDELSISIPGLTSCSVDGDCPAGQTCQDDLKCG